jgi:glycine betaine/proline transport system substrate-binding protein
MRKTGRTSGRVLALVACAALVLAGCGSGDIEEQTEENQAGSSGDCGELNMAVNPWVGYEADAYVVGHVAEQELGCKVNYKRRGWPRRTPTS